MIRDFAGVVTFGAGPRYFVGDAGEPVRSLVFASNFSPENGCSESGGSFGAAIIPATEITAEDLGLPWPGPLYVAPAPQP